MKFIHIINILTVSVSIISCRPQTALQSTTVNREAIDSRGNLMLLGKSTKDFTLLTDWATF